MKVKLTERQMKQLTPYFDRVRATGALGRPGMLVAQILYDSSRNVWNMDVGFIENEDASKIIHAANREIPGDARKGKIA